MTNLTIILLIFLKIALTYAEKKDEFQTGISFTIGNGNTALVGQFPYHAYIYYIGQLHCGASIIHKRWLLTAAHCKASGNVANYYVKVGTIHRNGTDGQSISIEKFIQHEEYDFYKTVTVRSTTLLDISNDIALIRLSNDVRFNEFVKLIKLARDDTNKYENALATVSGLGRTHKVLQPEELQYASVKVISDAECEKSWAELQRITFRQTICTSVINDRGSCNGDSGGPLVFRDEQIGIVSAGYRYCERPFPNIYTRVSSFISWIDRQLKSHFDVLP